MSFQLATLTANPGLIRDTVLATLRETDAAWQRRIHPLLSRLEKVGPTPCNDTAAVSIRSLHCQQLPDFRIEMTWTFSSWVPLVSKLLPNDTVTIYKRGSNFRMDSTLLGMEKMRWQRGQISVLLCGLDSAHPGSIFILDRGGKPVQQSFKGTLHH